MAAELVGERRTAVWAVIDTLVVVYALLPVLWILSLSLKPTSTVKDGKLIPSSVTLANYRGIFRGDFFSSALINSIGIGLITTAIAVRAGRDGGLRDCPTELSRQASARSAPPC